MLMDVFGVKKSASGCHWSNMKRKTPDSSGLC
jgi:hypothetical protein